VPAPKPRPSDPRLLATVSLVVLVFATSTSAPATAAGRLTFVESVPVETDLDLPDVPDAPEVWLDLVAGTQRSLDVFSFYFSPDPDGHGALTPVLDAVTAAGARGLRVRVLGDAGFYRTYPETHDRFVAAPGIAARLLDARSLWGGVLHAKGMIVDGTRFFVGSQNWDWRALAHIHELGVLVEDPALTADLARIFATDWALAGGETPPVLRAVVPDTAEWTRARALTLADGTPCEAVLAASPPAALPDSVPWDLPLLLDLMASAQDSLHLQMLSYNPSDRDGGWWPALDDALRAAAARGVTVRLIFSNWAKRSYMLPYIQSLAVLPRIEVRFTNLPEFSGGFIPFARVEHAKYATCDGRRAWVGTSNGSRDYFHASRNVSLFLRGEGCAAVPDAFFRRSWDSPYAETVDPCGAYTPPRRQ